MRWSPPSGVGDGGDIAIEVIGEGRGVAQGVDGSFVNMEGLGRIGYQKIKTTAPDPNGTKLRAS
jgi:hypothetical protein